MKFSTVTMFRKNLSAKKTYPVYFLAGEDTFLLEDSIKRIEKKINVDDLNREIFQATESSGSDILNSVETLPFLTDKRLVILKSANKLKNDDFKIITYHYKLFSLSKFFSTDYDHKWNIYKTAQSDLGPDGCSLKQLHYSLSASFVV